MNKYMEQNITRTPYGFFYKITSKLPLPRTNVRIKLNYNTHPSKTPPIFIFSRAGKSGLRSKKVFKAHFRRAGKGTQQQQQKEQQQ